MKSIYLKSARSTRLQAFRIILFIVLSFCGIVSCSNTDELETDEKVELVEPKVILEPECSYEDSEDITDEFWDMASEVLEKDMDYNQARFDDNIVKWEGKGVYLRDITISSISKAEYGLAPSINIRLGEKKFGIVKRMLFDVVVFFEEDSEIINFDVDEIVDVKGVIDRSAVYMDRSYNVWLKCGEIIKK